MATLTRTAPARRHFGARRPDPTSVGRQAAVRDLAEGFSVEPKTLAESAGGWVEKISESPLRYRVRVLGQHCGIVNRNRRRYPAETTWGRHTLPEAAFMKAVGRRRVLGQIEHPDSGLSDVKLYAIGITEVARPDRDGRVFVTFETLSTPHGLIIASLIADGFGFGLSSRGKGSTVPDGATEGVEIVQEDFEPATWDVVADESVPGAEFIAQRLAEGRRALVESVGGDAGRASQLAAIQNEQALKRTGWHPAAPRESYEIAATMPHAGTAVMLAGFKDDDEAEKAADALADAGLDAYIDGLEDEAAVCCYTQIVEPEQAVAHVRRVLGQAGIDQRVAADERIGWQAIAGGRVVREHNVPARLRALAALAEGPRTAAHAKRLASKLVGRGHVPGLGGKIDKVYGQNIGAIEYALGEAGFVALPAALQQGGARSTYQHQDGTTADVYAPRSGMNGDSREFLVLLAETSGQPSWWPKGGTKRSVVFGFQARPAADQFVQAAGALVGAVYVTLTAVPNAAAHGAPPFTVMVRVSAERAGDIQAAADRLGGVVEEGNQMPKHSVLKPIQEGFRVGDRVVSADPDNRWFDGVAVVTAILPSSRFSPDPVRVRLPGPNRDETEIMSRNLKLAEGQMPKQTERAYGRGSMDGQAACGHCGAGAADEPMLDGPAGMGGPDDEPLPAANGRGEPDADEPAAMGRGRGRGRGMPDEDPAGMGARGTDPDDLEAATRMGRGRAYGRGEPADDDDEQARAGMGRGRGADDMPDDGDYYEARQLRARRPSGLAEVTRKPDARGMLDGRYRQDVVREVMAALPSGIVRDALLTQTAIIFRDNAPAAAERFRDYWGQMTSAMADQYFRLGRQLGLEEASGYGNAQPLDDPEDLDLDLDHERAPNMASTNQPADDADRIKTYMETAARLRAQRLGEAKNLPAHLYAASEYEREGARIWRTIDGNVMPESVKQNETAGHYSFRAPRDGGQAGQFRLTFGPDHRLVGVRETDGAGKIVRTIAHEGKKGDGEDDKAGDDKKNGDKGTKDERRRIAQAALAAVYEAGRQPTRAARQAAYRALVRGVIREAFQVGDRVRSTDTGMQGFDGVGVVTNVRDGSDWVTVKPALASRPVEIRATNLMLAERAASKPTPVGDGVAERVVAPGKRPAANDQTPRIRFLQAEVARLEGERASLAELVEQMAHAQGRQAAQARVATLTGQHPELAAPAVQRRLATCESVQAVEAEAGVLLGVVRASTAATVAPNGNGRPVATVPSPASAALTISEARMAVLQRQPIGHEGASTTVVASSNTEGAPSGPLSADQTGDPLGAALVESSAADDSIAKSTVAYRRRREQQLAERAERLGTE